MSLFTHFQNVWVSQGQQHRWKDCVYWKSRLFVNKCKSVSVCVCHRGTIIGCRVADVFIRRQKDTWLKMGWIWEGNGQTQIANYILNNHIHQVIHPYSHLTVPLSNQSRNLSPHHSLNPSILLRFAHFPSLTRSSFIRPLLDGGSQRCLLFLWLPGINIDVWTARMDVTVRSERERETLLWSFMHFRVP